MTSFFITNICEVVFLVFFLMVYGCVFVVFSSINFVLRLSSILRSQLCFEFVHILVFSFYVMLKIDDRFRYFGAWTWSKVYQLFWCNIVFSISICMLCWYFLGVIHGWVNCQPIKNKATLMYVLNINNITKDVGCMFWVELIQILWCGR